MEVKSKKKVIIVATKTKYIKQCCIPILKLLQEMEYEVHVASNGNEEIEYCDKHYNLPFFTKKRQTYKILKQIFKENHYEFIQCFTFLGGMITRFAARKTKTKVIYTSDGFFFYKGSPIKKWITYYPLEKYLSKYTDILITTNQEDYILAKNKLKCSKVKLINGLGIDKNKIDIRLSEKESKDLLNELEINNQGYTFLSIGDLDKNNNQILQIEAVMNIIPEYKNIKLIIVGEGSLEEYYNNIILKYKLSNHVKLLRERKDIPELIQISDCILTTSKKEGLSNSVIKAMFANKPIIASSSIPYKYLLKDDNLIDINHSDELIRKMEQYIIMGNRKQFYDIEKYKLENIIEDFKRIYKTL